MPRLENWSVISGSDNPYHSPEQSGMAFQGNVYDHPNFPDGMFIHTSRVKDIQGKTVETQNNTYELGVVDPGYVVWYKKNYPDGKYDLEGEDPFPTEPQEKQTDDDHQRSGL